MLKVIDCFRKVYISRNFSICRILLDEDTNKHGSDEDTNKHKRKVKETVELVTLVDQNDKILGLKSKIESEKLARKLNMSMERVHDTKYGKMYPAYKMISTADLLKAEKNSTAKVLKKLALTSRISDHDLITKIQTIKKWLSKNCEVHITILGKNNADAMMKTLYTKLEDQLKNENRILDVRHKEESIKFIVMPPKAPKTDTGNKKQKKCATDDG